MTPTSANKIFVESLRLEAKKQGNGTLEQILTAAGARFPHDVYLWPSTDAEDAGLRRGVAYARASMYLEDKYLVTPQHAPQLDACVSLYDRMRAGIHACAVEHNVSSKVGKRQLNESAQVIMYHFGNKLFEDHDWQGFNIKVDKQVKRLGGKSMLPARKVSPCLDEAVHAADQALLDRIPEIGLGRVGGRSSHLSVAK